MTNRTINKKELKDFNDYKVTNPDALYYIFKAQLIEIANDLVRNFCPS